MKKSMYVTLALMLTLIFIGCGATMTPEQRRELYDSKGYYNLTKEVGGKPFVGRPDNLNVRGQWTTDTW